jgi:1-acyl-sn-glycerol-3-phosphate acyltransferase
MNLGKKSLEELKHLMQQLLLHMTPRELATMLFPPAMGIDLLQGVLSRTTPEDAGFNPDYPETALLEAVLELARWLSTNYFKTTLSGVEVLSADAPVLLVGNHSGGLMPLDALFAINEIRDNVSKAAVVHPLVHDFAYIAPRIAKLAERMGILRASKENAIDALRAGRNVLVYPGGDEDAFRTFQQRNQIVLAGRKGFIRLAMRAGVPIVPLVSVGLHESFMVLTKGRKLGRKLGLKRWLRTEIFPVALSLPWGLAPAFSPFLPLPTSIDMRFLAPIHLEGSPTDDHLVSCTYDHIVSVMQSAMDEMVENRVPFFGR